MNNVTILIFAVALIFTIFGGITLLSHIYTLNNIKSKTVGDGQHGTARWATKHEIAQTYVNIPFESEKWRNESMIGRTPTTENNEPLPQGIIVGCKKGRKGSTTAIVDCGDVHVLMLAAAGGGKTTYWLYPNIEYALASGMSFLSTDTKGDILRNYGYIASDIYHYNVAVIDLRNPTRSNSNNLLHLVNKY